MPATPLRSLLLWLAPVGLIGLVVQPLGLRAAGEAARGAAVEAYREGRYEDVLGLLTGQTDSELRYLSARALSELGRFEEALASLPEPPTSWPAEVRSDIAAQRLAWLAEAGRCAEVSTQALGTRDPQLLRFLARCAFSAGDFARVRELLATASDDAGKAMYARALAALGERDQAVPLLRTLYVKQPAHADASELARLLNELDPGFVLSPEEQLDRAEALTEVRQLEPALTELTALDTLRDKALEARRQHLLGEALFRTRKRYPEAAKAYAKAAALESTSEAHDAFHAARSTSRAGRDKDAIKAYRAFAQRYPKSSFAPDAVYLAAWLGARLKQRGAREELARFAMSDLAKRQKGLLRDAEWDLGWLAYQQKDHKGATTWLERYQRDAGSELESARASYWLGRSALAAGRRSQALDHFRAALEAERHGYYAQLAIKQLRSLGAPLPQAFDPEAKAEPWLAPALASRPAVAFYAGLGLSADAARALDASLPSGAPRTERIAWLLATGDAAKTFSAAAPLLSSTMRVSPERAPWLWQALFPRPYERVVTQEVERQSLPLPLFYGHMQVESRYRPEVVSSADAIGLMQLLPSTGAAVAKRLGLPATRRALKQPYINVALGAAFLGQLLQQYRGQTPLAIAAYNAGSERVNEWVKRMGRAELDRWVEEIPVEQTRNYVRRVITAWSRYQLLLAPQEPWSLSLPTHVSLGKP
jgi:soluble lytic murein transglycosylase